ncbi:MAG: ABC transporter permease [Bacteroidales bacterium]|nr:ABC transporter permease [Bacteroidales bacterium]
MDASFFIAGRLRFRRRIVMVSIAVSYLVMIVAVAVSSGFRSEIRTGLSSVTGDVRLTPPDLNVFDENRPIEGHPAYLPYVETVDGVDEVIPVIYRAGIVKNDDSIHGVIFKGIPKEMLTDVHDTLALGVSIPRRLAEISGLEVGDRMLSYFVGKTVKARQFNVAAIHDAIVELDQNLVVHASLSDMQRLNAWSEDEVSCFEILLEPGYDDEADIAYACAEIGTTVNAYSDDDEETVIATSSIDSYPQLFDWLNLIDFNVFLVLLLMTVVAGFNMISGLLIMLFENISTIGLLKSLGMTDKAISKVFLSSSSVLVLKGMAWGNGLAFLFCLIQGATHILKLNPENYFVSFVPVSPDLGMILLADAASFIGIMLLLLIPCMFISKVDPAETVRMK